MGRRARCGWPRWQGLRSSGLKMAEYARREGFNAHSAYRWLRRARRSGSGRFCHAVREGDHVDEADGGCSSRVWWRSSDAPAVRSAVLLRLVLINGRRAELEIGDVPHSARYSICWNGARDPATASATVFLCVAPTDLRKQAASSRCWWNRA